MEHRLGLDDDREQRDEGGGAELHARPARPEPCGDGGDEQDGAEQVGDVERHRDAQRRRLVEAGLPGQPGGAAGDRVEPRRRVVLALAGVSREVPARHESGGVGDVRGRVVALRGRVVRDVPEAEGGDEGTDRREREPAVSPQDASHRSPPCRSPRRARAGCAAGCGGRRRASGDRRTTGRVRSGRPRAARRGRGSAPSRSGRA